MISNFNKSKNRSSKHLQILLHDVKNIYRSMSNAALEELANREKTPDYDARRELNRREKRREKRNK